MKPVMGRSVWRRSDNGGPRPNSPHIQLSSLQSQGLPQAASIQPWQLGSALLTLTEGRTGVGSFVLIPVEAQGRHQAVQEADHVLRGAEHRRVLGHMTENMHWCQSRAQLTPHPRLCPRIPVLGRDARAGSQEGKAAEDRGR